MKLGKLAQMRNGTAPPLDSLTWLCLVGHVVAVLYNNVVLNMFLMAY